MPVWSGGALLTFASNQTPAPVILSFDEQGQRLPPLILTIPESETIDLHDVARGSDGAVVACGSAYDHSGRGSGFLAVFSPTGDNVNVIRLYPYSPSRVAVASDGTLWTAGLEVTDATSIVDSTPPSSGVIRHFDRAGRSMGSFKYTGHVLGLAPQYYEIPQYFETLSDGMIRKYPAVSLGRSEVVVGLALTDEGRTYVSTNDKSNHARRLLSIAAPDQSWVQGSPPSQLGRTWLYGADGDRLVFFHHRDTVMFVKVSN